MIGFEAVILLGFIHARGWCRGRGTLEFLLPLVFLHVVPFFEEILRFWADNEIENFVEKFDRDKGSAYSKDCLASFELEVAEG